MFLINLNLEKVKIQISWKYFIKKHYFINSFKDFILKKAVLQYKYDSNRTMYIKNVHQILSFIKE